MKYTVCLKDDFDFESMEIEKDAWKKEIIIDKHSINKTDAETQILNIVQDSHSKGCLKLLDFPGEFILISSGNPCKIFECSVELKLEPCFNAYYTGEIVV